MKCPECKYGRLIFRESSGLEPHGEMTDGLEYLKCSWCGEVWDADDPELEEIANAEEYESNEAGSASAG